MKLREKIKAISLRKKGHSYLAILKQIPVSKSTLSFWLREIELTPAQNKKLLVGRQLSRFLGAKAQQQKRIEQTKKTIHEGEGEFFELVEYPLFLAGLMLYWAEGDKHIQERVKFTNSDEVLVLLMMRWFREVCHVPEEKFRIALHVHNLHSQTNVKEYWQKITGVRVANFQKVYVKQSSLHQRRNILYNGTCGIIVHDKKLFRKILGWKNGASHYFHILPPRSSMDRTKDF